jgi:hypothetical protein
MQIHSLDPKTMKMYSRANIYYRFNDKLVVANLISMIFLPKEEK